MELILTNTDGNQVRILKDVQFDCELNGGDRDFALTISLSSKFNDITSKCRVFVENTEIGGLIGERSIDTSNNTITYGGYTWRGMINNKIIVPPDGQDYYTVSGELNSIISDLFEDAFSGIFTVSTVSTGVTVTNYQFDRFCTLLEGLTKMLESVDYRLEINYVEGSPNQSGYVEVSALPITDFSSQLELSQDNRLNFNITDIKDGVNHLVVGGKGELQERNVLHLYVQEDGTIGDTQYYFGNDEIMAFYDNTSTETDELREQSIKQLESLMNRQSFDMDVETLNIDVAIGDIIGGRDQITGVYVAKPLENIVVTIDGDKISKQYTLKGDDNS